MSSSGRNLVKLEEVIRASVGRVRDPLLGMSLDELGFVGGVHAKHSSVKITLALPTRAYPQRDALEMSVTKTVKGVEGLEGVEVSVNTLASEPTPRKTSSGVSKHVEGLERVGSVVAVSSCKGGVGKSTVAMNLGASLASLGARVGVLDADVHGPSLPLLLHLKDTSVPQLGNGRLDPVKYDGEGMFETAMKLMSFGYVGKRGVGAAMRGPMVSTVVTQLAQFTDWGALDVLVVDFPPGTGDIPITLGQKLALSGAVVVTTPHPLAIADVERGLDVFHDLRVPIWSLVENMAHFDGDDGKRYYPFGHEAGEELASRFRIPHHLSLPISPQTASLTKPAIVQDATSPTSKAFTSLASYVLESILFDRYKPREVVQFTARYKRTDGVVVIRRIGKDGAQDLPISPVLVRRASGAADAGDPEAVPEDVIPLRIEPQGNYGVAIAWSDGHNSSIYTYEQLWELAKKEH